MSSSGPPDLFGQARLTYSGRACEVLNNNKFTFVNVCFQHKCDEEIGIFWQALNNLLIPF